MPGTPLLSKLKIALAPEGVLSQTLGKTYIPLNLQLYMCALLTQPSSTEEFSVIHYQDSLPSTRSFSLSELFLHRALYYAQYVLH